MTSDVELGSLLLSGEELVSDVAVDGFFSSEQHTLGVTGVWLTSDRYLAVSRRGVVKKRLEIAASWPLIGFTDRINSSEGRALGPFLHFVTLFTPNDETVSAAFRSRQKREDFKTTVAHALAAANGW